MLQALRNILNMKYSNKYKRVNRGGVHFWPSESSQAVYTRTYIQFVGCTKIMKSRTWITVEKKKLDGMVSWKSPFNMIFCQITFWILGGRITFSCCWFRVGAGREALVPHVTRTIWFFSWQCPVSTCRRSTNSQSCFCKIEMLMNERLLYRPPAYLNLL